MSDEDLWLDGNGIAGLLAEVFGDRHDDRRPRLRVVRRGTRGRRAPRCTAAPGSCCAARRAATSRCRSPCSRTARVLTLRGDWTLEVPR